MTSNLNEKYGAPIYQLEDYLPPLKYEPMEPEKVTELIMQS